MAGSEARSGISGGAPFAMDFSRFEALTFDCYGTLIDWEAGILGALRPILSTRGFRATDEDLLALHASLEPAIQRDHPSMPYAEVLARVTDGIAAHHGFALAPAERSALARSLPDWPAFPDTAAALSALGHRFRLCITSNIDNDLIAATVIRLGARFDEIVTAQQVGSYKPAPGHWREAMKRLGVRADRLLHVAQSLYHDVAPARSLGISTVWVDRYPGRSGAVPPSDARPDLTVPDLATLARLALAGWKPPFES